MKNNRLVRMLLLYILKRSKYIALGDLHEICFQIDYTEAIENTEGFRSGWNIDSLARTATDLYEDVTNNST